MRFLFRSTLLSFLFLLSVLHAQTVLTVNVTGTAACDHDGSATATVTNGTGPYTYQWSYGTQTVTNNSSSNTNTITNLPGGFIMCQVTDANQFVGYGYYQGAFPFYLFASAIPDTCNQGLGSALVNVSGGTAPYTYLWSNSQTTQTATGLTPGLWDVSVTDAAGCNLLLSESDSTGAYVWNTANFNVTCNATPSSCNDGTATAIASGPGTPPYTYYWFTNPVQTTQTASNLAVGSYQVRVTDATGCYTDDYVYVTQGASPFLVTAAVTDEYCISGNGAISLSISGGTSPFTFLWSNGATTQNVTGLSYGSYTCTITDAGGCPVVKYVYVQRSSPIVLSFSASPSVCAQSTGTATVNASGGTPPYTYLWNNGQTTQTASGLSQGYYSCSVTDANGCYHHGYVYVTQSNSCFVNITGRVSRDQNSNCVFDPGDNGIQQSFVYLNPGGYVTTNFGGYYSFWGPPGTYTVSHTTPNYYSTICPATPGTITVNATTPGSTYANNDFFDAPSGTVNDLRISGYAGAARPGFSQILYIYYYNDGNTVLNGDITVVHDASLTFQTASINPTTYNATTQTATWSLGPLQPGTWGALYVYLAVPVNAVIGTQVTSDVTIDPVTGDATPLNNTTVMSRIVSNAYDPNNKEVYPGGNLALTDTTLTYVINFQNTGNDTAFTVVVSDTLESDLDVTTFMPGCASHPYTWQITGQGIVEFTFANIELPDSHINEPASHGLVSFQIEAKNTVANGTQVINTGNIYFDFNVPVVTNDAITLYGTTSSTETEINASDWKVFPNPNGGIFSVRTELKESEEVEINLYDMLGRKVFGSGKLMANAGMFEQKISPDVRTAGVYMLELNVNGKISTARVVMDPRH